MGWGRSWEAGLRAHVQGSAGGQESGRTLGSEHGQSLASLQLILGVRGSSDNLSSATIDLEQSMVKWMSLIKICSSSFDFMITIPTDQVCSCCRNNFKCNFANLQKLPLPNWLLFTINGLQSRKRKSDTIRGEQAVLQNFCSSRRNIKIITTVGKKET